MPDLPKRGGVARARGCRCAPRLTREHQGGSVYRIAKWHLPGCPEFDPDHQHHDALDVTASTADAAALAAWRTTPKETTP